MKADVGELGIGNGYLALQILVAHPFQGLVRKTIHSADKEGGNRCRSGQIPARGCQPLQAGDVGFGYGVIVIQ